MKKTTYKVLQYFQWGQLKLETGQRIIIEDLGNGDSIVSVDHYPDKTQRISSQATDSMVFLKKIEKY